MITERICLAQNVPALASLRGCQIGENQSLQEAKRILQNCGFTHIEISNEDDKDVITIRSTVAKINKNMKAIVDASNKGILVRCKSEFPEE